MNKLIMMGAFIGSFFMSLPSYAVGEALTQSEVAGCVGKAAVDYPDSSKVGQIFFYCINKNADTKVFLYMEDINECWGEGATIPQATSCLNQKIDYTESNWKSGN